MREKCTRCPSLIPASRMAKHLELKHDLQEIKSETVQVEIEDGDKNDDIIDDSLETVLGEVSDLEEDDNYDTIVPMGHSKRKRAVIEDDEDEETPKEKKINSPVKEEISDQNIPEDVSSDMTSCSYCSLKIIKDDIKAHMSSKHAWLDSEIDESVTYGGTDLGDLGETDNIDDVDYDDVEVDYDEEGDDFFEEHNYDERHIVTEDCDFCEESVDRLAMNEHLLKKHDINMTEDSQTPALPTSTTDMSMSSCPVCKTQIATAILPIHITYYHAADLAKLEPAKPAAEQPKAVDDAVLGEQCEMCDERIVDNRMVAHLLEAHDIKVIDDKLEESSEFDNSVNDAVGGENPFDMPDFLKEKPKPKYKCHHCQKKFSTREKVDIHVNKRHDKKCQVCVTYRLVQENRYIGIMKQLNKTAKGLKDDVLPTSDNNVTGQVEDLVYNYEDLYPEEEVEECEECEDDFYWRNKEHSCDLSMANVRILNGKKFNWGDPDEEVVENKTGEQIFEYVTNKLGKSIVDRASKAASTAYISDIVNDIVSLALDNKQFNPTSHSGPPVSQYIKQNEMKEDQNLQLKSQILAYRYVKRKEAVPNIVERAANYDNFRNSPRDELRKLNDYFYKEYKEDIEKEEKENYEKKADEKKRLQEDTLREMTTNKLYDYSKYFIPSVKPLKKARKMQPKKEQKTPLLDSMMNNSMDNSGFKLPSGSALQMNDRNYLNKLKQHQEKTVKKLQMIQQGNGRNSQQYHDTVRELEVENKRLQNLNQAPNFRNPPFRPNSVKQEPGIKLEPGLLRKQPVTVLGNMPGISIKRVEPPQPPKLEIKKESPAALQRLQSLGLSISVGQKGQTRLLEPAQPKVESGLNRSYPGTVQHKPPPVLNNSVLEQYRQLAGIKKQHPESAKPKPQSLWNASAKGRESQQPVRSQIPPSRENPQLLRNQIVPSRQLQPVGRSLLPPPRELLQPVKNNQQFREPQHGRNNFPVQNRQPQNPALNREPARDTFKKPPVRTYNPASQHQQPVQLKSYNVPPAQNRPPPKRQTPSTPKAEYTDSQKLQLKSQILAYRMVTRKERLPHIVKMAASNTNLKSMNMPKNEMRSLSNFFRQEYSAIA